jgi:hypothetical protein
MFDWFDASASVAFGKQLADDLLVSLSAGAGRHEAKFAAKAEKALIKADARVRDFRRTHKLNVYKRSKLANSFLWALKDGGCAPDYAQELTEWLTYRL